MNDKYKGSKPPQRTSRPEPQKRTSPNERIFIPRTTSVSETLKSIFWLKEKHNDDDIEYTRSDIVEQLVKNALEMAVANVGNLKQHGLGTRQQFHNLAINKAQDVIKALIRSKK